MKKEEIFTHQHHHHHHHLVALKRGGGWCKNTKRRHLFPKRASTKHATTHREREREKRNREKKQNKKSAHFTSSESHSFAGTHAANKHWCLVLVFFVFVEFVVPKTDTTEASSIDAPRQEIESEEARIFVAESVLILVLIRKRIDRFFFVGLLFEDIFFRKAKKWQRKSRTKC